MNSCLKKLGFHPNDRVIVVHADDIGACQASIPAFETLIGDGLVSCGSAMPPTPWFGEVARWKQDRSDADLGVHITLASEYESYRWRPLARHWKGSSLVDETGFFHRNRPQCEEVPTVEEALEESRFQIQYAKDVGLAPTHFDNHKYILFHPKFVDSYLDLAHEFKLPPLITKTSIYEPYSEATIARIATLEDMGLPIFDHMFNIPLRITDPREDIFVKIFEEIEPGLTYIASHPVIDTPEARAASKDWEGRVGDFNVLGSEAVKLAVKKAGVTIVGYRDLTEAVTW